MYQREKVKEKQIRVLGEQTRSIGTVSVVPMGEWRASVTYKKLNIVRAYNALWIAKKDNIGIEPTITSGWLDNWQVVAYDGTGENVVVADGNYPLMTVGNANNAQLALAAVTDNEGNNIAAALTTNAKNITTIKESLPTKVSQSQITQSLGDSQALLISQKAISTIINDIKSKLDFLSNNHIVCVLFDNISPASILGGTWVLIKDRFLIGASGKYILGATGGSEDSVVVEHFHTVQTSGGTYPNAYFGVSGGSNAGVQPFIGINSYDINKWGTTDQFTAKKTGEIGKEKNMPPFIAVNIWVRDDDNTIGGLL